MTSIKRMTAALLALMLISCCLFGCEKKMGEPPVITDDEISSVSMPESSAPEEAEENLPVTSEYSAGLTKDGCFQGVRALDYVTLPDYRNAEIPKDVSEISDDEVMDELKSMMSEYIVTEQVTDREVKDGDTVNIDYVGSIDGVEFEGGNTHGGGTNVTIGVTNYIDDFLEQLIGHKPGETVDVYATFPEDYGVDELNGKEALFVTVINYIAEDKVPELTDKFVADTWKHSKGWTTVTEAKDGVRAELRKASVMSFLWSMVISESEVTEVPEAVYQYQENNIRLYYTAMAEQYDVDLDTFMKDYVGVDSLDEMVSKQKSALEDNARTDLITQALSEDMGIKTVSDSDIADYFEENIGVTDYSSYEERYGRQYLGYITRSNLVKQKLRERG